MWAETIRSQGADAAPTELVDLPLHEQVRRGQELLRLLWQRPTVQKACQLPAEPPPTLRPDPAGGTPKLVLKQRVEVVAPAVDAGALPRSGPVAIALDVMLPKSRKCIANRSLDRHVAVAATRCEDERADMAWEKLAADTLSDDSFDLDDASTDVPLDARSDDGLPLHDDEVLLSPLPAFFALQKNITGFSYCR